MADQNRLTIQFPTSRRGGAVSVEIQARPIVVDVDPLRVGRPIAEALAAELRAALQNRGSASAATVRSRQVAAKAYSRGEAWARERYPSGPPTGSTLLRASGHLADHLRLTNGRDDFAVRAPAGRMSESGVRDRVMALLRPVIQAVRASRRVAIAKRAALQKMVTRGSDRSR